MNATPTLQFPVPYHAFSRWRDPNSDVATAFSVANALDDVTRSLAKQSPKIQYVIWRILWLWRIHFSHSKLRVKFYGPCFLAIRSVFNGKSGLVVRMWSLSARHDLCEHDKNTENEKWPDHCLITFADATDDRVQLAWYRSEVIQFVKPNCDWQDTCKYLRQLPRLCTYF